MYFFRFLWIFLFFIAGCMTVFMDSPTYRVARDQSWYPLNLRGKEKNLVAFSDDLLVAIGKEENCQFSMSATGASTIEYELENNVYDAILSSMDPTPQRREKFVFSKPYFLVGPVLIVPKDSTILSLADLKHQQLGTLVGVPRVFNEKIDSSVIMRSFNDVLTALDALSLGEIDAILLKLVPAYLISGGTYKGQFRVVGPPLTQEGIRLVARKNEGEEMIARFNSGLEKMRESSTYKTLIKKWGLVNPFFD